MSQFNITANALPEANDNFEPIPAGIYQAQIKSCEQKATNDGTGIRLNFGFSILAPTNAGRMVFAGLNIKNKSEKAQEISLGQLRQIMEAVNLSNVTDTDQFIGKSLQIKVKVKAATKDVNGVELYPAGNDVSGFKTIENGGATMPIASAMPTMGVAPVIAAKPNPWETPAAVVAPVAPATPVAPVVNKNPWK